MPVYEHACVCVRVCLYSRRACVHLRLPACVCVFLRLHACVPLFVRAYVPVFLRVCEHACVCVRLWLQ